uniref:Uncharacterized protein n=1 Tax=Cacopsylla melanoneura TaxID=428564 RepID=A0A8D9B9V3_9HEMI
MNSKMSSNIRKGKNPAYEDEKYYEIVQNEREQLVENGRLISKRSPVWESIRSQYNMYGLSAEALYMHFYSGRLASALKRMLGIDTIVTSYEEFKEEEEEEEQFVQILPSIKFVDKSLVPTPLYSTTLTVNEAGTVEVFPYKPVYFLAS